MNTHIYGVKPGFMDVLGVFCHVCKFQWNGTLLPAKCCLNHGSLNHGVVHKSLHPSMLCQHTADINSSENVHFAVNIVLNIITEELMKIYGSIIWVPVFLCTLYSLTVIHYTLLSPSVTKDTTGIRGCASCFSACHRWFTLNQGENRGLLTRSSKAPDVSD